MSNIYLLTNNSKLKKKQTYQQYFINTMINNKSRIVDEIENKTTTLNCIYFFIS